MAKIKHDLQKQGLEHDEPRIPLDELKEKAEKQRIKNAPDA